MGLPRLVREVSRVRRTEEEGANETWLNREDGNKGATRPTKKQKEILGVGRRTAR